MHQRLCFQHASRGQALTEFVVLCAVLVPMLLLFPIVYKYIDIMNAGEQASRYVAFESTVHTAGTAGQKSPEQLSTEIGRRFFSRPGSSIDTDEGVTNESAERLPLWNDAWGRALVDPQSGVGARVNVRDFNAIPSIMVGGSTLAHGQFQLPQNRQAIADISIQPNKLARLAPFDELNPLINRTTAVLGDPWTASGPDDARRRFENLGVIYNPLGAIRILMDFTGQLPRLVADQPMTGDGFRGPDAWYELPCDRIVDC